MKVTELRQIACTIGVRLGEKKRYAANAIARIIGQRLEDDFHNKQLGQPVAFVGGSS